MAGEENKTQSVDPFALLQQMLTGGMGSTAQNSVYLGTKTTTIPSVIAKPGAGPAEIPNISTIQQANALYLTDAKLRAKWRTTMQKNGLETGNPLVERRAWETAVAGASDWYSTSNGSAKITPEQYLQWWAGGTKGKAKPDLARQVYQYSPEQIDADINDVSMKVLGRTITDEDKQSDWYKDLTKGLNKMISKGIVTTSKTVKNKKTGKLEQVTTQTPEFSKEAAQERITQAVEAADPESLERKRRIDNTKWLLSRGGRG